MDTIGNYLISKEGGKLQIPYSEYEALMGKLEEARHVQAVQSETLEILNRYLNGHSAAVESVDDVPSEPRDQKGIDETDPSAGRKPEKVSLEFSSDRQADTGSNASASVSTSLKRSQDLPPVKPEVEDYFNSHDSSGRLLNVFIQYYTCLNETCQGVVRVTMKDGICSFWNYDKWEEFAFVDVHEGQLRFTMDPRYTDDLCSLDFCEVTRLLAARGNYISIAMEDLNKTMLDVLTRAFDEVGLTAD